MTSIRKNVGANRCEIEIYHLTEFYLGNNCTFLDAVVFNCISRD